MHYFFFHLLKFTGPWKGRVLMTICTLYIFAFTLYVVWITFTTLPTHLTSSANVFVMSEFLTPEAPQGSWCKLFYSFSCITNTDFFRYFKFIKGQFIRVSGHYFIVSSYFLTPCFWSAISISSGVANERSRLLITPLNVFSFVCGYVLHLILWNLSLFSMFSGCIVWTFSCRLPFLCFLIFWGLHRLDMIFFLCGKVIIDPILFHPKIQLLWIL